jgi:hypothetical protein
MATPVHASLDIRARFVKPTLTNVRLCLVEIAERVSTPCPPEDLPVPASLDIQERIVRPISMNVLRFRVAIVEPVPIPCRLVALLAHVWPDIRVYNVRPRSMNVARSHAGMVVFVRMARMGTHAFATWDIPEFIAKLISMNVHRLPVPMEPLVSMASTRTCAYAPIPQVDQIVGTVHRHFVHPLISRPSSHRQVDTVKLAIIQSL